MGLNKTLGVILLTLMLIICSNCSYRSAYEGIQASNRFECTKLPSTQYDECIKNASKSYDQYERERKQTLNQK